MRGLFIVFLRGQAARRHEFDVVAVRRSAKSKSSAYHSIYIYIKSRRDEGKVF